MISYVFFIKNQLSHACQTAFQHIVSQQTGAAHSFFGEKQNTHIAQYFAQALQIDTSCAGAYETPPSFVDSLLCDTLFCPAIPAIQRGDE
jgi:hypothetical protein